jgi:hypothetical protein
MHLLILVVVIGALIHYGKMQVVTGFLKGLWHGNRTLLGVIVLVALVLYNPALARSVVFLGCAVAGIWYMARRGN